MSGQEHTKLLKDFENILKKTRPFITSRLGEDTSTIIEETRSEYEVIIPDIPYLGGMEPFTRYVTTTAQYIAIYRVLKRRGMSLEEIGQFIYDLTDYFLSQYPRLFLRFLTGSLFTRRFTERARKREELIQRREYPENYVYNFIEGDGVEFDYGVDYTECAVCKLLEKMDAMELAPYMCALDIISSDKYGWGLKRTMTIAEGAPLCDFRFKKGAKTSIKTSVTLKTHNSD